MKKHPQLSRKLELLYSLQINPAIRSHSNLAHHVGVSRQSVSRWCRGTITSEGDCIPHYQVVRVSSVFDIEPNWFTLALEDFEQRVRNKLENEERVFSGKKVEVSTATMPITRVQLFGRTQELELLDEYWQDRRVNVIQLIAFGGVGKSSLVNRWLSDLNRDNYRTAKRVYAWSFYWQGESSDLKSSGDFFIEHALEWFGDKEPTSGSPWAKASRLTKLIRSVPTLLILDGLEPMQFGPGSKSGQVENPAIALLIRELATENSGLCVITSRLPVADLNTYLDGRVETIDLEHISQDAGIELLKSRSVFGDDKLIEKAAAKYSGHPLSLSLLGGYISVVHQGDISKFRELVSLADEQAESDHTRTLVSQYFDWLIGTPALELLFLITMFDRTVFLSDIAELARSVSIDGLTKKLNSLLLAQWSYALKQLEDASLVSVRNQQDDYCIDCHPLVRDFVSDHIKQTKNEIWIEGNKAIFYALQDMAVNDPASMAELEPLFRAVIHGAKAEMFDQAFELYFRRIKRGYTMLTEGSHYSDQACIRAFFVNEWTETVPTLPIDSQFHLISSASANLMSLGMIEEAIDPSLKSIEFFVEKGLFLEATHMAGPLISMLIEAGQLHRANLLLEELRACAQQTNNPVVVAMGQNFQAYICYLCGEYDSARELFKNVEKVINQLEPGVSVNFPTVSSYYCKYLLDTGHCKEALERSLKTFAWRKQRTWQVAIDTTSLLASDLLVLGLIFLKLGDRVNAKVQLDKQVELFKSADEWLYLPTGLNSRARLNIALENFADALHDLQESLEISSRTGAKFGEWEAYIDLAQLHYAEKDYRSSEIYLRKARELPNMDAYKFRNAEMFELEEKLSAQLSRNANEVIDNRL